MEHSTINLFCVVGASPAVVTETVYALTVEDATGDGDDVDEDAPQQRIDQVVIVTTTHGRDKLERGLYQQLRQMADDYPDHAGLIPTDPAKIKILVPQLEGQEIDDVRSPETSSAMADDIFHQIKTLTKEGNPRLYTSIAGGRKTMGYFAGNAMMFYGRDRDRLTHVLATGPAESSAQFFYPTPTSQMMETYGGESFDASEQSVELHEIPFIRLPEKNRAEVPGRFIEAYRDFQRQFRGELNVRLDLARLKKHGDAQSRIHIRNSAIHFRSTIRQALFVTLLVAHKEGDTPLGVERLLTSKDEGGYLEDLFQYHQWIEQDDNAENAYYFDVRLNVRTKDKNNTTTHIAKLRKTLQKQLNRFDFREVCPSSDGQGYKLKIDPEHIEIEYPA